MTGSGLDNPNLAAPNGKGTRPRVVHEGSPSARAKAEQKTLDEILRLAVKESGRDLEYSDVLGFINTVDPSAIRSLSSTKGTPADYREECDKFVAFLASVKEANCQRTLSIIISEIVSYIHDNTDETVTIMNFIKYCCELYARYKDETLTVPNGIGYTKMKVMVDNAFIIEYLKSGGISNDFKVGNGIDDSIDELVKNAVNVAYNQYVTEFSEIANKYILAYKRIENDRPEMLKVADDGDYEAFYKMLRAM